MTKTYLLAKQILAKYPETRGSDQELQWKIWEYQGVVKNGYMSKADYIYKAKHFETIRRTRQKIQERHPELRATLDTLDYRREIERSKGTWIFTDNTARFITS